MTPYKIELYVYAETPEQAKQAQDVANRLVAQEYRRGVLVTAGKVAEACKRFAGNYFVEQFLKSK